MRSLSVLQTAVHPPSPDRPSIHGSGRPIPDRVVPPLERVAPMTYRAVACERWPLAPDHVATCDRVEQVPAAGVRQRVTVRKRHHDDNGNGVVDPGEAVDLTVVEVTAVPGFLIVFGEPEAFAAVLSAMRGM